MTCRICGSDQDISIGSFRPYLDHECTVHDCRGCGCRFVEHDALIYERLYSSEESTYACLERIAQESLEYFNNSDMEGMKSYLARQRKYAFIISTIENNPGAHTLLEIGCSKGYLAGYFLAKGYDVLGVDQSPSAIQFARELFGDQFVTPESERIERGKPYDVIYHAGTIGCVDSPIQMTRDLLSMLRQGGILVFNSPNVNACWGIDQFWVNGTPPPDLVTLFPPVFWKEQFNELADVKVVVELLPASMRWRIALKRLLGIRWKTNPNRKLFGTDDCVGIQETLSEQTKRIRDLCCDATRFVLKPFLGLLGRILLPKYESEFDMFVIMRK